MATRQKDEDDEEPDADPHRELVGGLEFRRILVLVV